MQPSSEISAAPAAQTRTPIAPIALVAAGLVALIFAVFFPAISYGLINLDDPVFVAIPTVMGGPTAENIKWAFTTFHGSNWFPLPWLSLQIDAGLYRNWYGGFHLTSILFHCASAVTLFMLLLTATGAFWRAAAVAALFAIHPLRVEPVVWLTERNDVIATFLGLLCLVFYVRYARAPHWRRAVPVFITLALGLLARPVLVTWPAVMMLLDIWPLRRWRPWAATDADEPAFPVQSVRRLIVEKIPYVVLVLGSIASAIHARQVGGAVDDAGTLPLSVRAANAAVSYARYLGNTFWPMELAPYYPYSPLPAAKVVGAVVLGAAITAMVIALRKKQPELLVGWFWFAGTLVPMIGLMQVGAQARADRYTYIPQIGLLFAIVWLAGAAVASLKLNARAMACVFVVVLAMLALVANRQVKYWRNSETLWQRTVEINPINPVAQLHLALAITNTGEIQRSIPHLHAAVSTNPEYFVAQAMLGVNLLRVDQPAAALEHLTIAARLRPNDVQTMYYLGATFNRLGRYSEAIARLQSALALNPKMMEARTSLAAAHNGLGVGHATKGDLKTAVEEFNTALRADPNFADAKSNLARAVELQSGKPR